MRRRSIKWIMLLLFLLIWTNYVEASIVLKVVAINPSKTQVQKVPFKAYLPKEVSPENIIEKGDLEVAYDTQQGCYYVYKDFELEPGGSVTREIEIKDIWVISLGEINSLRDEVVKIAEVMKGTDFQERTEVLKSSIERKLNEITGRQSSFNPMPEGHISDYRQNLALLDEVKQDLMAAKTLLGQAKSISPMTTWRLIVAIVVFLGILGLTLFIIWQHQVKMWPAPAFAGSPSANPDLPPAVGERREAKVEKKVGVEDIEKKLKEKGETGSG